MTITPSVASWMQQPFFSGQSWTGIPRTSGSISKNNIVLRGKVYDLRNTSTSAVRLWEAVQAKLTVDFDTPVTAGRTSANVASMSRVDILCYVTFERLGSGNVSTRGPTRHTHRETVRTVTWREGLSNLLYLDRHRSISSL